MRTILRAGVHQKVDVEFIERGQKARDKGHCADETRIARPGCTRSSPSAGHQTFQAKRHDKGKVIVTEVVHNLSFRHG